MQYVLAEIDKLRNGDPIIIDYHNSNRYRLVVNENDDTKTAYYFSTPIYDKERGKMLDLTFQSSDEAIELKGSNTKITITNKVIMENAEGMCTIELPAKCDYISSREVHCGNITLLPTTNGVAIKTEVGANEKSAFVIDVGNTFFNVRANDKSFSLMREQFRPFAIFSCIGAIDEKDNVIAPSKMEYQKINDRKYRITVSTRSPMAKYVLFEANLYESKLFQDTTVESGSPYTNNVFGSVGFIGNSSEYGVQWLYSRLDYSKIMPEINDKHIIKAILHIPKLNQNEAEMSVFKVMTRFCSFGSNWENKISGEETVISSKLNNGYQTLDVTSMLVNPQTQTIKKFEGMILKPKIKGTEFSVISTGDSCLSPQVIEINYR